MTYFRPLFVAGMSAALLLGGCGKKEERKTDVKVPVQTNGTPVDYAITGDWRGDHAGRDNYRHPKETLTFFGFDPSKSTIEIFPGGGWYTSILAPAIKKGGGRYSAAIFEAAMGEYYVKNNKKFVAKFADEKRFGNLNTMQFGATSEPLADASADLVLSFRNVHNWMGKGYADKAFADFYAALKPGGILGIVEHRLPESREQDMKAGSGYVQVSYVKSLAEEAGFEFVGASEINANPKDNADHPFGVWTLPPASRTPKDKSKLPEGFDPAKYLKIGESDRFTLKFRKPE
ncbi:MAG: methyltransferase domain-containing protein [Robiginitomaculum sp.]